MNTIDDIRAWARERFEDVREEGGLALIGLVHYSANGSENALHVMSSKMPADRWNPDAVATTMDAIASRDARGYSGVQQYRCICSYGSTGKPNGGSLPFQRVGGLTHGPLPGGGYATEGPHPTGIVATGQRWGELAIQQAGAKDQLITGLMGGLLDKVLARLDRTERLADERGQATMNVLIEFHKVVQASQMRMLLVEGAKKVMPLLPALAGTTLGLDVPTSVAEDSYFATLVASFTPAQHPAYAPLLRELTRATRRRRARDKPMLRGRARSATIRRVTTRRARPSRHCGAPLTSVRRS
jgi:hypothetical protein